MRSEPIAIIGAGCRFPGASSPAELWRLLRGGGDAVTDAPRERWDVDALYDPDLASPGKISTRRGGFIEGVHDFDAAFFDISVGEAAAMDPQQRLLLEVSWEALEDAGLSPERISGTECGVFLGVGNTDLALASFEDPSTINAYFVSGNAMCMLANRLSYAYNITGPSMTLDTGCSASLAAVHMACESLRTGESNLALAGGVNLLSERMTIGLSQAWMMAADGKCKSFDASADGYVRGEGCGIVLLKRLSAALSDGDRILAVLRGSAVNHGGRSDGLTAPSEGAQKAVLRRALDRAGIAPEDIDYIEAHGVGTPLADRTEIRALGSVLGGRRARPCVLGSVKANIGHLEQAAGIASLLKVIGALDNEEIPPQLHFTALPPTIEEEGFQFQIPVERSPWPAGDRPRIACVNSFGLGGTNACAIVEEPPARGASSSRVERPLYPLVLSARTPRALVELARRYERWLAENPDISLGDVAYSACTGRAHLQERLALVAGDVGACRDALGRFAAGDPAAVLRGSLMGAPPTLPAGGEPRAAPTSFATLYSLSDATDELRHRLETLGALYVRGVDVRWDPEIWGGPRLRCSLPSYPFERKRYQVASPADAITAKAAEGRVPERTHRDDAPELVRALIAAPLLRRRELLIARLQAALGALLDCEPSSIDPRQGLFDMGIGSLSVVHFQNRLKHDLGGTCALSPTLVFERPTLAAIAEHLLREMALDGGGAIEMGAAAAPDESGAAPVEPIAVIGLACRFPGAATPDDLWVNLKAGVDATREVPADRWPVDLYYSADQDQPGTIITRRGGFLDKIDGFDCQFFGIAPREAASLDPQQRLFLEVAWEALENAGQAPDRLAGTQAGVFVGVTGNEYMQLFLKARDPALIDGHFGTGNIVSAAAGRLSYLLGLHGPSVVVDTACSSSLVAIHLACQSLRLKECDIAVAGGVNLILTPELSIFLSRARAIAPDGRCKTFDASADGYGRGEGCGAVTLKRLCDAVSAGDTILAVITGSAVNHDGSSSGFTVPNGLAQQALVRDAQRRAGVRPWEVDYIEAHGTGTILGDPIEVRALGAVLGEGRGAGERFALGSVKTNLGHLEAAAGVAGFIKTVLSIRHGEIPPHLHFKEINPRIPIDELPFTIPTALMPWPTRAGRRIAGVSSFGMSGTNAHIIVEQAPEREVRAGTDAERQWSLLCLSAKSETALRALAGRYEHSLAERAEGSLADVCFSANTGRSHFAHRASISAQSASEMRARLGALASGAGMGEGTQVGRAESGRRLSVGFLFTGQGSQYVGMGRELYGSSPSFRRVLERCDELLRGELERPLLSVLYGEDGSGSALDETAYTQPALFALQMGLVEVWRTWGVEPAFVLGHSVGEFAAACSAGLFSLEDGLRLVAERARLMQGLGSGGGMAAIFAPLERVEGRLRGFGGGVSIAAYNGPAELAVAGESGAVQRLVDALSSEGIRAQRLSVSHAFHSALIEPMLDELERSAGSVRFGALRAGMVSNVTGRVSTAAEVSEGRYWRRHAREPVQFYEGVKSLAAEGCDVLVEIGPQPSLLAMARRCLGEGARVGAWLPSLRKGRGDEAQMLESLGALYVRGASVDWSGFDKPYARNRVALPTYPFQRARCWIDALSQAASMRPSEPEEQRTGVGEEDWYYEVQWRPNPARDQGEGDRARSGPFLILADAGGVGRELASRFKERGARYMLVDNHADGALNGASERALDRANPEAFDALLADFVAAHGELPSAVLYLWGLSGSRAEGEDVATLEPLDSCSGALSLAQALVKKAGSGKEPHLWIITRRAQRVRDDDARIDASGASLWGLGRAIGVEHPEIWGGLLDIDNVGSADVADAICDALDREDGESQTALRGGELYLARLARIPRARIANEPPLVRADATYLITGGLGALGLHVARWLCARGARRLVLVGRRRASVAAAAAIKELTHGGAQITQVEGDIAERDEVASILDRIASPDAPLRGVFHAAGVLDDGVLLQQSRARLEKVFAPKVRGTWNLHTLTRGAPLDFFVLFSSAASLFGMPGQSNYAAANAFVDAVAHMRRSDGLPGLSINWGPWAGSGMAAGLSDAQKRRLAGLGLNEITPSQGLAAMDMALSMGRAEVGVLDVDWRDFIGRFGSTGAARFLSELGAEGSDKARHKEGAILERVRQAAPHERSEFLRSHIRAYVAQILGFSDERAVDPEAGFFSLGMDSLMALDLKRRIEAALGLKLPSTFTFNYPTVVALSKYIEIEIFPPDSEVNGSDGGDQAIQEDWLARVEQLSDEEVERLLARTASSSVPDGGA